MSIPSSSKKGKLLRPALRLWKWANFSRVDLGRALLECVLVGTRVRHVRRRVVDGARIGGGWSLLILIAIRLTVIVFLLTTQPHPR